MSDYIKFAVFSHDNFFKLKVGKKKKTRLAQKQLSYFSYLIDD